MEFSVTDIKATLKFNFTEIFLNSLGTTFQELRNLASITLKQHMEGIRGEETVNFTIF